ncbi:MAG TPA: hypothetical protein VGH73_13945 [Thermoanaerobaculia bacterium]
MAAQGNRGRLLAILGLAGGLALVGASLPAEAQFFGGWWGGWRAAPAPYGAPIPPRRVASIVASEGFALSGPPRREGDVILADGVDSRGQHMHFVIDAYDGEVIRSRLAGPPRPPANVGNAEPVDVPAQALPPQALPPQAHAGLMPDQGTGPRAGATSRPGPGAQLGGAQPGLEPAHPLAKPKTKKQQTAARNPAKPGTAPVPPKVPSEAQQVKEPAAAPAPGATGETAPAIEANAPAPAANPATPLAPDAAPVNPPAPPAPAATEAKAAVPAATTDIGPSVKKVDPAPTAAIPAAPAPAEPVESK